MFPNLGLDHVEKFIYQELYNVQYRRSNSKMLNYCQK